MRCKLWICVAANIKDDWVRRFCRIPLTFHKITCFNISSVHQLSGSQDQDALRYTSGWDRVSRSTLAPFQQWDDLSCNHQRHVTHPFFCRTRDEANCWPYHCRAGSRVEGGGEIERKLVLKEGWKPSGGLIEVTWGWTGKGWCGRSGGGGGQRWRRRGWFYQSLKQALAAALPGSDARTGCSSGSSTGLQETAINRPPSANASWFLSWMLRHSHTSDYSTPFTPPKLMKMKGCKE